jgi:hypothetical protein
VVNEMGRGLIPGLRVIDEPHFETEWFR